MNLKTVDPNGAFVEAVTWLVVELMDPRGDQAGAMIPWRTGPDGEVGIPVRLVAQATGRPVEDLEDLLVGRKLMGEDALFMGRQGAKERLSIGAMADEVAVNIIALPTVVRQAMQSSNGQQGIKLLGVQAASVAALLERLAGAKAATA